MKKVFLALLVGAMVGCCACSCTCGNQRTTDEVVVEAVDTAATEALEAVDTAAIEALEVADTTMTVK